MVNLSRLGVMFHAFSCAAVCGISFGVHNGNGDAVQIEKVCMECLYAKEFLEKKKTDVDYSTLC